MIPIKVLLPYAQGELIALLHRQGVVEEEKHTGSGSKLPAMRRRVWRTYSPERHGNEVVDSQNDSSPIVNRLLSGTSTWLAVQRGVPMLGGTVLVVISCLAFGVILP